MEPVVVGLSLGFVIYLYFATNPMRHGRWFMFRRFVNWFPLGMSYAFLYMGRYNLNVAKNALGASMSKESFGLIFGVGTAVYACSFLLNGPLVDKIGGKRGIILATLGSAAANIGMGISTYLFLTHRISGNLTAVFAVLYALNMFFQSYGAVSIIKVKSYWFHVRERGVFGAIFGTFISAGVYFAFDWGQAVVDAAKTSAPEHALALHKMLNSIFAIEGGSGDATWLVFFVPSIILGFWAIMDVIFIKDSPSEANLQDFDTHDASSGQMHVEYTMKELLHKVFTSPIMILIALVELTTGVVRNGVMQWYPIFAKEIKQPGAEYFASHWGFLLFLTGVIASFSGGYVSDHVFHSRRGPPAGIFYCMIVFFSALMAFALKSFPLVVGISAVMIAMASIGVHALMSGTAAADFGGRKATATASGITDGFVYLGGAIQSVGLGFLVTKDWSFWPYFLIPFAALGLYFTFRMWTELPAATRHYLLNVEKVDPSPKSAKFSKDKTIEAT